MFLKCFIFPIGLVVGADVGCIGCGPNFNRAVKVVPYSHNKVSSSLCGNWCRILISRKPLGLLFCQNEISFAFMKLRTQNAS